MAVEYYAVEQLRQAGRWVARNAEELVGEVSGDMPVTEDSLTFTIELRWDGFATVSSRKEYIVLPLKE